MSRSLKIRLMGRSNQNVDMHVPKKSKLPMHSTRTHCTCRDSHQLASTTIQRIYTEHFPLKRTLIRCQLNSCITIFLQKPRTLWGKNLPLVMLLFRTTRRRQVPPTFSLEFVDRKGRGQARKWVPLCLACPQPSRKRMDPLPGDNTF